MYVHTHIHVSNNAQVMRYETFIITTYAENIVPPRKLKVSDDIFQECDHRLVLREANNERAARHLVRSLIYIRSRVHKVHDARVAM